MMYAIEMASAGMVHTCIYDIPSLIKINTGVQAILRFALSNLNDCNVGTTNGRYL
jgi:hypothetical protein